MQFFARGFVWDSHVSIGGGGGGGLLGVVVPPRRMVVPKIVKWQHMLPDALN